MIGVGNISSLNSDHRAGQLAADHSRSSPTKCRPQLRAVPPRVGRRDHHHRATPASPKTRISCEGYEAYLRVEPGQAVRRAPRPAVGRCSSASAPMTDPKSVVRVEDSRRRRHRRGARWPPAHRAQPAPAASPTRPAVKVILSHGGAFSKYVIRLDTVIQMPDEGVNQYEGGELVSFDFEDLRRSTRCGAANRMHDLLQAPSSGTPASS